MEIKIRNLSETTVKELDFQAKKKGLSRQEYLKVYVEKLAMSNLVLETESKYETLVKKILGIVELNMKSLKDNTELFNLTIKSLEEFSNENLININKYNIEEKGEY